MRLSSCVLSCALVPDRARQVECACGACMGRAHLLLGSTHKALLTQATQQFCWCWPKLALPSPVRVSLHTLASAGAAHHCYVHGWSARAGGAPPPQAGTGRPGGAQAERGAKDGGVDGEAQEERRGTPGMNAGPPTMAPPPGTPPAHAADSGLGWDLGAGRAAAAAANAAVSGYAAASTSAAAAVAGLWRAGAPALKAGTGVYAHTAQPNPSPPLDSGSAFGAAGKAESGGEAGGSGRDGGTSHGPIWEAGEGIKGVPELVTSARGAGLVNDAGHLGRASVRSSPEPGLFGTDAGTTMGANSCGAASDAQSRTECGLAGADMHTTVGRPDAAARHARSGSVYGEPDVDLQTQADAKSGVDAVLACSSGAHKLSGISMHKVAVAHPGTAPLSEATAALQLPSAELPVSFAPRGSQQGEIAQHGGR